MFGGRYRRLCGLIGTAFLGVVLTWPGPSAAAGRPDSGPVTMMGPGGDRDGGRGGGRDAGGNRGQERRQAQPQHRAAENHRDNGRRQVEQANRQRDQQRRVADDSQRRAVQRNHAEQAARQQQERRRSDDAHRQAAADAQRRQAERQSADAARAAERQRQATADARGRNADRKQPEVKIDDHRRAPQAGRRDSDSDRGKSPPSRGAASGRDRRPWVGGNDRKPADQPKAQRRDIEKPSVKGPGAQDNRKQRPASGSRKPKTTPQPSLNDNRDPQRDRDDGRDGAKSDRKPRDPLARPKPKSRPTLDKGSAKGSASSSIDSLAPTTRKPSREPSVANASSLQKPAKHLNSHSSSKAKEILVKGKKHHARHFSHVKYHDLTVKAASCGHSFCHGRPACVYVHDYCDPIVYRSSWCDSWRPRYCGSYSRFGFGYSSSHFSLSLSFGDDDCDWPGYSCSSYSWPRRYYCYDGYSYNYPSSYACYSYRPYRRFYWNDCWRSYYRPVYGCYRPRYVYYQPIYVSSAYDDYGPIGYEPYDAGLTFDTSEYAPTWLKPTTPEPFIESDANAEGWDFLSNRDPREARRSFDRAVNVAPGDGLPQIGYAISAALLERYAEAVAFMRSALRDDPEAINEVPQDQAIDDQIRQVLRHYEEQARLSPRDSDALIMAAALRHLLGNAALAYFAVDSAIENGDDDPAALNLKNIVQDALEHDAADEPAASEPTEAFDDESF